MTPEPLAGHTMSEELKPCPFCGGECDPEGWYGADTGAGPRRGPACNECGATADSVTAWNRRASLAQQAGEDARDAARYRWLRIQGACEEVCNETWRDLLHAEQLDAAIDQAMKGGT